jgi:hypothetical protein
MHLYSYVVVFSNSLEVGRETISLIIECSKVKTGAHIILHHLRCHLSNIIKDDLLIFGEMKASLGALTIVFGVRKICFVGLPHHYSLCLQSHWYNFVHDVILRHWDTNLEAFFHFCFVIVVKFLSALDVCISFITWYFDNECLRSSFCLNHHKKYC